MLACLAWLVWDARCTTGFLNSLSVIISWIMTSNKGCSVHASSPIVANSCFVHGDDYFGLGVRGDLEGYKARLSERFIIKDRGILGADGLHEIRILNRVITYHPAKPGCPEMLTYEADQRHADLLMAAYGLNASSKAKAIISWDSNFPGSTSTGRTMRSDE